MDRDKVFRYGRAAALAVFPVIVAKLTAACPALFTTTGALALAGGVAAAFLASRRSNGGAVAVAHASLWTVLGSLWVPAQAELAKLCGSDFLHQVPTIATTAVCVGLASFVAGKKEPNP